MIPPPQETTGSPPPTIAVQDVIRVLRENLVVLVGSLALGIMLGLLAQLIIPRAYESRARFIVNEIPYLNLQATANPEMEQALVETLIMSIPSQDMRDAVSQQLKVSPKQIVFTDIDPSLNLIGSQPEANIRLSSSDKNRMGEIIVTSQSPQFAADVANAVLTNLQLFNRVAGRLKNIQVSMDVSKAELDATVNKLVDASSQRSKLEQENAELDDYIAERLPLRDFPSFAQDGTLNNLKTQLILVDSEYAGVASTATRGSRLDAKRAEYQRLEQQLNAHVDRLVGALRTAYSIAKTDQQNIESQIQQTKDKLDRLSEQFGTIAQTLNNPFAMRAEAGGATAGPVANIIIPIDPATAKNKPQRPKLWLNMLLGVVFGLGLGIGLTGLRVLLDTRLRSARQIEERTGQSCLALLPPLDPIRRTDDGFHRPRSPIGMGYLRSILLRTFIATGKQKIIGFTPAQRGGDTSLMVATLGILLAQAGHRTLILDLYRNSGRIATMLGAQDTTGLTDWITSNDDLKDHISLSVLGNLGVLGLGRVPHEFDSLLGRRPISLELAALEEWDFVVIASPAIRFDWTMMLTLPAECSIIIAADYQTARTPDVTATVQRARNTHWKVEGVVLQNCPERISGSRSL